MYSWQRMHSLCTFTLPLSVGRYVFCQISPNFSNLGMMSKIRNITESICEDSVSSARHGARFSGDNEGCIRIGSMQVPLEEPCCRKSIMVGSIEVPIEPYGTNVQDSSSHPLLNRSNTSIESKSMSNPIPFPGITFNSDQTNLRLVQTKVDSYRVPSFSPSSESNSLSPAERLPAPNITRHHDRSSFPTHLQKNSRVAYAKRPYSAHRNLNNALAGHKLYPLYIKPFDICRPGRHISALDISLHANKESCTEMRKGVTEKRILKPGMVLLKHYLTHNNQVELVKICRKLGLGPGGFYQPGYKGGAKLQLQMMCLGLDWNPQTRKYGNRRSIDGCGPPNIPHEFRILSNMAIEEAQNLSKKKFRVSNVEDVLPSMSPDVCIVNFYTANGRLGLHQDRDESRKSLRKGLPVVSLSVGDSAEFLYGDQRDVERAEKVVLESGDVLIFGGESRHIFHGVSYIIPNSAPKVLLEDTGLRPGRLNLTFRQF